MNSPGRLATRDAYRGELKRLFIAAGHRRNEFKQFEVVFQNEAKARRWDFPGSSVYHAWRAGESLPSKQYAKLFDALIAWLLDHAAAAGDTSFPPRDMWSNALSDLHQGRPARRGDDGLRSSPNDISAELARWCTAEAARYRAALSRLPYLAGHPDPYGHNITAHARLGLRQGGSADRKPDSNPYRLVSDNPGDPAVEMPYLDVVADRAQLVIVGDAGIGKTWLLHHHAGILAQAAAEGLRSHGLRSDAPIPVLVRADTLAEAHQPGRSLAESVSRALALSGSRIPKSVVRALVAALETGPVVFLIDALDETAADQYAVLSELLNPLDNIHPGTRYVVTSRLASYVGIFHNEQRTEAELLPFESAVPYIDSWQLSPDRRAELLDRVGGQGAIAQMARIPLLLAFLCHLAKDTTEDFPDGRAALYQRITRRFLMAEHKPHHPNLKAARAAALAVDPSTRADELLDILHPLAYRIATDANGWLDTIPHRAMLEHLKHVERPVGLSAAAALDLLATDAGILVPTGSAIAGRTPDYRFIHRTLAEYLTAAYVAASPELIEHCARHHLHLAADWQQTWLLCVQLNPTAALTALGHPQDALHIAMNIAARAVAELGEAQRREASEPIAALTAAAGQLLETTTASDPNSLAANALGDIGGSEAVASLSKALLAPSSERRRSDDEPSELPSRFRVFYKPPITNALARTAHPTAIATLARVVTGDLPGIESFSGSDLHHVRAAAAQSLASCSRSEAIAHLTAIANNPQGTQQTRIEALAWLAFSDQPEAIDVIVGTLIDDGNDVAVRQAAQDALTSNDFHKDSADEARGRVVGRALISAMTGQHPESDAQLVNALIELFWSTTGDGPLHAGVFDLLASLKSPDAIPTFLQLLHEMPSGDALWRLPRNVAMRALGQVKALESIETLIEVLLGTRELSSVYDPRESALETLVEILDGHPAAGDARERALVALTRVCRDREDPLSGHAAAAVVRIGDDAAIGAIRAQLMALLDEEDCYKLDAALSESSSPTAAQIVLERLRVSGGSEGDDRPIRGLRCTSNVDVLDDLLAVAQDPDGSPTARIAACKQLLQFRPSAAIGVLRGIFEEERSGVTDRARALVVLGTACDVPTLKAIVASSEPDQLKSFATGLGRSYFELPVGTDEYCGLLECLIVAHESGYQSLQQAAAAAAAGLRFATVLPRHRTPRALAALWEITASAEFRNPTLLMPGEVAIANAITVTYVRDGEFFERIIPEPPTELSYEQLVDLAERYGVESSAPPKRY